MRWWLLPRCRWLPIRRHRLAVRGETWMCRRRYPRLRDLIEGHLGLRRLHSSDSVLGLNLGS